MQITTWSLMLVVCASAVLADETLVRIDDPLEKAHALVGDLGDPGGGGLEEAARRWLAAKAGAAKVPLPAASARADVQDGTPVRLVRFRDGEGPEVAVAFGKGTRVIGVAVSPGYPAAPPAPADANASASATSLLGLSMAAPGGIDWRQAKKAAASGSPAELQQVAELHAARARAELVAHGAGPRFDAIVGPLRLIVAEERTQSGRRLVGNAFYSSRDHALHFAREDAFPSAADPSIVVHEYGHAAWHALVGAEPVKPSTVEQLAVYEGHADAFATLVTGDPVVGRAWLAANGDEPRDAKNDLTHGPLKTADPHALGRVYSGLLWSLAAGRPREEQRALVLGGLELAPRPVTPAALVTGLLLADRFFLGGAQRERIVKEAERRGVPFGIKRAVRTARR